MQISPGIRAIAKSVVRQKQSAIRQILVEELGSDFTLNQIREIEKEIGAYTKNSPTRNDLVLQTRFRIAYDYHSWQTDRRLFGCDYPSVKERVNKALSKLVSDEVRLVVAERTPSVVLLTPQEAVDYANAAIRQAEETIAIAQSIAVA